MTFRTVILTGLALLTFGSGAFAAPLYATTVEEYAPVGYVAPSRSITGNALGAPDDYENSSDIRFLSLGGGADADGYGGYVVLSFGQTFTGSATIYETTYDRPNNHREYAYVYGSADNQTWDILGEIYNQDNGGASTVTFAGIYSYLKILDITDLRGGTAGDGYDVDAVAVTPTPIPGAAWLLGSGLIGLVGLRRRFSS
ncbi:MAG: hypothetical protein H0S80_00055 [Desulfovibrionaceae bacterium]|nr:hypothetical protein [Desulfovibrionaceae bacterium]